MKKIFHKQVKDIEWIHEHTRAILSLSYSHHPKTDFLITMGLFETVYFFEEYGLEITMLFSDNG